MSTSDNPAGPKACEAIAATMIGHFATRLEVEAAKRGALSAADIRAVTESFLGQEFDHFQPTHRRSYDACSATREAGQWELSRKRPFDRLLMKSFAHLFPPRQGDDGGQGLLSRRLIPGFSLAIDKMIGPALYEQCQRKSQAILDRHKSPSGHDWDAVHADAQTQALINDVLVVVAHYFAHFERRRDWFLDMVNSHLGKTQAQAHAADAHWHLTAYGFAELMRALFADLRAALLARPDVLGRRYGEHTMETVQTFLERLERD